MTKIVHGHGFSWEANQPTEICEILYPRAYTLSSGWRVTPCLDQTSFLNLSSLNVKHGSQKRPPPTFILISLETLCAYTCRDMVLYQVLLHLKKRKYVSWKKFGNTSVWADSYFMWLPYNFWYCYNAQSVWSENKYSLFGNIIHWHRCQCNTV